MMIHFVVILITNEDREKKKRHDNDININMIQHIEKNRIMSVSKTKKKYIIYDQG